MTESAAAGRRTGWSPLKGGRLGVRLVLVMLLALAAGFGASGAMQLLSTSGALTRQMDRLGTTLARSAAASLIEWVLERQYTYVQTYVDSIVVEDQNVAFMVVTLPDGQVVATRPDPDPRKSPLYADCRVYEHPVRVPSSALALKDIATVILGLQPDQMSQVVSERTQQTLSIFSATFLVLAVVVIWLLRRMLHDPLSRLDQQTRALAQGNLEQPIAIASGTELGRLAQTLEQMRRTLRDSYTSIAEQHDQLLALDRLKAQFLANLSHELRTPLTAVLGFTDLLEGAELGADGRGHVETIRRNALHLHTLLNELLDLARLGSGELLIETAPFDPRTLTHDVVEFLRPRAEAKNLALRLELRGALPSSVLSDPTRVRQVLLNLVNNAIKFTERGEVVVAAAASAAGDRLVFTVRDSGPGVPPEVRNRLFEPWTQSDAALSRRVQGLGIGLSISRAIAARLGGEIGCDSELGVGSTFTFALPVGTPAAETAPVAVVPEAEAPAPELPAPPRILLAEDAPDNQRLVSLMLRRGGFDVTVAANGKLACEAAVRARDEGNPFAAILMDIQMPEMDGHAAAQWLREHGFHQPIVAVTAHSMESDRQRSLAAGCDDYLTKPLGASKLLKLLRNEIARRRQVPGRLLD